MMRPNESEQKVYDALTRHDLGVAHTPEPWETHHWGDGNNQILAGLGEVAFFDGGVGLDAETVTANCDRAVACVNALAGIDNPASFVNETLGLLDAARHELSLWLDYRQDDQDTARVVDEITEFLATVNR